MIHFLNFYSGSTMFTEKLYKHAYDLITHTHTHIHKKTSTIKTKIYVKYVE